MPKITKQWLLTSPPNFWSQLVFLLAETSPHFGKLGWNFRPKLGKWPFHQLEPATITELKSVLNQLPANANQEQIYQQLMTTIFWVAPDYDRTRASTPTYEYDELDQQTLSQVGLSETDRLPRYPAYPVSSAPANYRPLKIEEIQPTDIHKFQQKVNLLAIPYSEQLLTGYQALKDYYQTKHQQVQQKLTHWTQLIINRHHD